MDNLYSIGIFVLTQVVIIVLFYDRVIKPFLIVTQRLDINTSKTLCTATEEIKKLSDRLDTMQGICSQHQGLDNIQFGDLAAQIERATRDYQELENLFRQHRSQAQNMWKIIEKYGDELKMHHEQLHDLYASMESVVRETRGVRNESSNK